MQITLNSEAEKLLQDKLLMMREINKVITLEPEQELKSKQLKDLFDRTQSLPEIQNITEEDIAAEIAAYRRGE